MNFPKSKRLVDNLVMEQYRHGQCVICRRNEVDPCHIKSRGSGGPDCDWNLLRMCREHHTEQHKLGWQKMTKKYSVLYFELKRKGWQISADEGMWHPNLTPKNRDVDS